MREVIADQLSPLPAQIAVNLGVEGTRGVRSSVDMFHNHDAVVAAGHPQPPPERRHDRSAARTFDLSVAPEIAIKMLVMSNFIVCNVAGQHGKHGLRVDIRHLFQRWGEHRHTAATRN